MPGRGKENPNWKEYGCRCGETDPTEFYKRWKGRCKSCSIAWHKEWRSQNPDKVQRLRDKQKLAQYGLTLEKFDQMNADQGGVCLICGLKERRNSRLSVDHNHQTGAVRGLLCSKCNSCYGWLEIYRAEIEAYGRR